MLSGLNGLNGGSGIFGQGAGGSPPPPPSDMLDFSVPAFSFYLYLLMEELFL